MHAFKGGGLRWVGSSAGDRRRACRREAAGCSDPARLIEYSTDHSPQVRREVAANPHTPAAVLDELAGDHDWRVRGAVGQHPEASDAGLLRLVDDPRWEVRLTMLTRPDLSTAAMMGVCHGARMDARRVLAGDQRIPLPVAEKLASDPDCQVRQELAEHTVFDEVRTILRADPRPGVRELAAANAHQCRYGPADPSSPSPQLRTPGAPVVTAEELAHWPALPRRPSTRWVTIAGNFQPSRDEIPPYVEWLWRLAKAIDTDTDWIRWWSGSPVATIELYPLPDGEIDVVSVHRESDRVRILGSSRALFAWLEPASTREESGADARRTASTSAAYRPAPSHVHRGRRRSRP